MARETSAPVADGEAAWRSAADLKFLQSLPRFHSRNFKSKAALDILASALCFPKFAKRGVARAHELRKAGTRYPDADIKLATMLILARRQGISPQRRARRTRQAYPSQKRWVRQ